MVWRRKRGQNRSSSSWTTVAFLRQLAASMVVVVVSVATNAATATATPRSCRVSEFACASGQQCVPLNRFCNGINDCNDSSDEPRYCTKCNRTYYGEADITYDLELHRPKEAKIPYICHLTFTANGGEYGDIIQLKFDSFTVGRFVSFTSDGCPDGALQISESNRPHMGGSWCGTSWGPSIYYSETKSVTVSVSLLRLSKSQSGYNFDFRMEYKFLKKMAAVVRYGGGRLNETFPTAATTSLTEPEYYLGDLISGTYCSRIFSDCDRKRCRLQSPNFPGLYPRNVTCYYAVRQHEVPQGKHALIIVRQPKGQLVSIRSQAALYGTASTRELKVWNACDDVQDYVTVYDGYTTRDPVILKFCGGGEAVPKAVSSGHELLVEFSTSPYGTFLQPTPIQPLHGFQLEVEVKFVDQQSPTYIKTKRQCEFWIRGTNKGILENPIHSVPANTTCMYHLQGMDTTVSPSPVPFRPLSRYPDGIWTKTRVIFPPPRYRVWLTVIKFYDAGPRITDKLDTEICRSSLKVWDGQLWNPTVCKDLLCKDRSKVPQRSGNMPSKNVTLLGRYCREHMPKSCDHVMLANDTRFPRPCFLTESYLSSGDSMTLELNTIESTALRPVNFRVFYEFVDLHQDGEPYGVGPCSRKFTQTQTQRFKSPKDIFLYGRGGLENISCVYRFEAKKDEKVKITLTKVIIKGRNCVTKISPNTDRFQCYGNRSATLRFFEIPWNDVPPISRDCVCSEYNDSKSPITYISTSNVVELRFDATNMSAKDDYTTLFFEGTWQFIRTPTCNENLRNSGPSGEILLKHPNSKLNCENYPRVIIPTGRKYLYVKIHGVILQHFSHDGNETKVSPMKCLSANRITVHTSLYTAIVCPYSTTTRYNLVEIFSEGWHRKKDHGLKSFSVDKIGIDYLGNELSRSIVVEFLGKEEGTYSVRWLELSRRRVFPSNGLNLLWTKAEECLYRCPEIDACINSTVWCDGVEDCPSGIDEALTHCSFIFQLPPLYLFLGLMGIILLCTTAFFVVWKLCKRRRTRSFLQTRLRSLSSDTAIIDEKGIIC
ncbi:uncharacterized protein LOC108732223 [Agrilus planipennis]|uniref:Uncharacterized protein LOC108732223 n=1 Tax=Agrilus planipennis TaxID=224129 RepID=A0A7F5RMV6_AGRPL|nr:uncharacterized protein LOC108732223 [Agrilus planipennis]